MKVSPLRDRIIAKRLSPETMTKGGIYIPGTAEKKSSEAIVIAVGAGIFSNGVLRPLDVKEGDFIIFANGSGLELKIDGVEHLILTENDVLAIVEEV